RLTEGAPSELSLKEMGIAGHFGINAGKIGSGESLLRSKGVRRPGGAGERVGDIGDHEGGDGGTEAMKINGVDERQTGSSGRGGPAGSVKKLGTKPAKQSRSPIG